MLDCCKKPTDRIILLLPVTALRLTFKLAQRDLLRLSDLKADVIKIQNFKMLNSLTPSMTASMSSKYVSSSGELKTDLEVGRSKTAD